MKMEIKHGEETEVSVSLPNAEDGSSQNCTLIAVASIVMCGAIGMVIVCIAYFNKIFPFPLIDLPSRWNFAVSCVAFGILIMAVALVIQKIISGFMRYGELLEENRRFRLNMLKDVATTLCERKLPASKNKQYVVSINYANEDKGAAQKNEDLPAPDAKAVDANYDKPVDSGTDGLSSTQN